MLVDLPPTGLEGDLTEVMRLLCQKYSHASTNELDVMYSKRTFCFHVVFKYGLVPKSHDPRRRVDLAPHPTSQLSTVFVFKVLRLFLKM